MDNMHLMQSSEEKNLGSSSLFETALEEEEDQLKEEPDHPLSVSEKPNQLALTLRKETIEKLYSAVRLRDSEECPVTPQIFTDILQESNNIEVQKALMIFEKIDWSSLRKVSWNEFCTFLQLQFSVKEQQEIRRKEVSFVLPAAIGTLPHRDHGVNVLSTADNLWITTSTEATIALFNNQGRLIRHKLCLSKQRLRKKKTERQWIPASLLMPEFSKVVLTTGDRQIQFYDMASFSPFCQISGLESVPIAIFYKAFSRDRCLLTYGDQMGCVSIIIFYCVGKAFRIWKKLHKDEDFIPSIPIEQAVCEKFISFQRTQIHKDWVMMVRYYPETDQIISSSKDPHASLVIGRRRNSTNVARQLKEDRELKAKRNAVSTLYALTRSRCPQDQLVYSLSRGVNVFDFNPRLKLLATGGTDRMIRLWNCFLNKKPIAKLWGHYDIIKFLYICSNTNRLLSASADRWVKVWDIVDHTCLQTLPWHAHMVTGDLRSVGYNPKTQTLALLGDNLGVIKLQRAEEMRISRTHREPVSCILHNPLFNHIISASEESTVRIWNVETGSLEVEFTKAHDNHGIADMTLDATSKRLITVGRDGSGRMWNYNTGQCVRLLQQEEGSFPLSAVTYVDMYNVKYIFTGGWSHRINLYIDDTPETIPFVLPLLKRWHDDLVRGHTMDILCCDFNKRDKVATGGFDGQVMIWNMDTGYRSQLLIPPKPQGWSQNKLDADKGIHCLHFLKQRSRQRRGGNLVVGGPYGYISIWNTNFVRQASAAMAHFSARPDDLEPDDVVSVTAIDSDEDNVVLVTGDSGGRVTLWAIEHYALQDQEEKPPERAHFWMAHMELVTGVQLANHGQLVVSASTDRTVRVWTQQGHYIGTFGQAKAWQVGDELTYKHPNLPTDIQDFYFGPGDQDNEDLQESDQMSDAELPERSVDHFEPGISYFARHKAVLSKRGRHMNDEIYHPFSCMGMAIPFGSLRYHELQPAPEMPSLLSLRHKGVSGQQVDE